MQSTLMHKKGLVIINAPNYPLLVSISSSQHREGDPQKVLIINLLTQKVL